ncbi:uncharacterized protein LOC127525925 [Erpetoichthys calabaricus]|uniref:uncharacterized protein LOC127525925 n=1 Tax=Erpetoichthys calabaricus TaxID=27687 RepID=UPI0022347DA6|nr:uncharacterized protein LOC127525925 [Erpetoichthys calabaricus]
MDLEVQHEFISVSIHFATESTCTVAAPVDVLLTSNPYCKVKKRHCVSKEGPGELSWTRQQPRLCKQAWVSGETEQTGGTSLTLGEQADNIKETTAQECSVQVMTPLEVLSECGGNSEGKQQQVIEEELSEPKRITNYWQDMCGRLKNVLHQKDKHIERLYIKNERLGAKLRKQESEIKQLLKEISKFASEKRELESRLQRIIDPKEYLKTTVEDLFKNNNEVIKEIVEQKLFEQRQHLDQIEIKHSCKCAEIKNILDQKHRHHIKLIHEKDKDIKQLHKKILRHSLWSDC